MAKFMEQIKEHFEHMKWPTPQELKEGLDSLSITDEELKLLIRKEDQYPYGRNILFKNEDVEIVLNNWTPNMECAPHDHGRSFGWVKVLNGSAKHTLYTLNQHDIPAQFLNKTEHVNTEIFEPRSLIHSMGNPTDEPLITLHVYSPPISNMKVYNLEKCAVCIVSDDCGAWWPKEQRERLEVIKLKNSCHSNTKDN